VSARRSHPIYADEIATIGPRQIRRVDHRPEAIERYTHGTKTLHRRGNSRVASVTAGRGGAAEQARTGGVDGGDRAAAIELADGDGAAIIEEVGGTAAGGLLPHPRSVGIVARGEGGTQARQMIVRVVDCATSVPSGESNSANRPWRIAFLAGVNDYLYMSLRSLPFLYNNARSTHSIFDVCMYSSKPLRYWYLNDP
jgi:hypothetical protein